MIKNMLFEKKGEGDIFISRKTLTLTITIVCILGLIYFSNQLYTASRETELRNKANGMMSEIANILVNLKEGSEQKFLVSSVDDWYLASFRAEKAPPKCSNTACLCACKEDNINSCSNENLATCKGSINIILKDKEQIVQYLKIRSPVKGADLRETELLLTKLSKESYEISYLQDKVQA